MAAIINALGTMAVIIGAGWLLGHPGTLGAGGLPSLARICFAVAIPSCSSSPWRTPTCTCCSLARRWLFLASPAAGYVHGEVLAVDGRWMAR